MTEGPNVITKTHDLVEWFLPIISKFPRNHRYSIGIRLESSLLEILELLIQANYQKEKIDNLKRANIKLEVVRHLVRICYKLQFLIQRRYEYVSVNVSEIGKMIGGWIKQQERKN